MFQREVIPLVDPQRGVRGHIPPAEAHFVWEPRVDVSDEGGRQVTDVAETTPIQMGSHVVLPILEQDGHPGPYRQAAYPDVLEMTGCRHKRQLPPQRSRGLCEHWRLKPSGNHRNRERLLELPVLSSPFNDGKYLRCEFLGLVTERRQALNSLVVGAQSAVDYGCMPSDVRLGILYHFLL